MIAKSGKLKVVRKVDGMYRGTFELDMLVINANGRNWIMTSRVSDTGPSAFAPYPVNSFRGINPENEESLMVLLEELSTSGVDSYEWLEPLTEVN